MLPEDKDLELMQEEPEDGVFTSDQPLEPADGQ